MYAILRFQRFLLISSSSRQFWWLMIEFHKIIHVQILWTIMCQNVLSSNKNVTKSWLFFSFCDDASRKSGNGKSVINLKIENTRLLVIFNSRKKKGITRYFDLDWIPHFSPGQERWMPVRPHVSMWRCGRPRAEDGRPWGGRGERPRRRPSGAASKKWASG